MKELKDYLHLYLGCEAKSSKGTMVYKLSSVDTKGRCMFFDGFGNDMWLGNDFTLLLRPLSDMTEEEAKEAGLDWLEYRGEELGSFEPKQFLYLLSNHFDLFNLIESGLAVDKSNKTIKT